MTTPERTDRTRLDAFRAAETPLPDTADRELAGYWEGTREGRLRVQRCDKCSEYRWPPRAACSSCQSFDATWTEVPASGTLFSWTVVAVSPTPGFADLLPYAVGVVQLDDVPVRMAGFVAEDPHTLVADERLTAEFVEKADGVVLPVWQRETP